MRARLIVRCTLLGTGVLMGACGGSDPEGAPVSSGASTALRAAARPVAAVALAPGDCLRGVAIGSSERAQIETAQLVTCDEAHAIEVFAVFPFSDDASNRPDADPTAYPGLQRVVEAADAGCDDRISSAVDDPDPFGLIALWPTPASWAEGDRTIACAVYSRGGDRLEGPTTG